MVIQIVSVINQANGHECAKLMSDPLETKAQILEKLESIGFVILDSSKWPTVFVTMQRGSFADQ